ncbi:APC family permease [Pedococcus cremeus]|nr:amino acid permease [Pedococcus cremeus]
MGHYVATLADMHSRSTRTAHRSAGLTVPQGAALTTGAVLGTGVITLPAVAAQIAGPASILAWVGLVALSVPLAGTFGALGARFPDGGGVSTYVRAAFGHRAGAVVGWWFFFAVPVGAPPAAMMAGGYVADAVGGGRGTTVTVAVVLLATVTATNARGLRISGRVQLCLTATLAVLLAATVVAALPEARLASLRPFAPHGWTAVAGSAAVLVWAFAGWEAVASLAGEYRDPARAVPRVTAVAVTVVGTLYVALAAVTLLVLGPAAGSSTAPLSDLLAVSFGGPIRAVTALVAVLLTLGTMNAYLAGVSRLGAALARDGALPAYLASGHELGGVPRRSLALVSVLSGVSLAAAAATGVGLGPLMLLASGCFTLVYVVGTAAAVRLLPRHSWAWRGAVVALASVLVLLVFIGLHALWAVGVGAAALAYQGWRGRRDAREPAPARSARAVPVPLPPEQPV